MTAAHQKYVASQFWFGNTAKDYKLFNIRYLLDCLYRNIFKNKIECRIRANNNRIYIY